MNGEGTNREVARSCQERGVVVLIPAFNEAPTIAAVIDEVLSLGLDLGVCVIDNGSTDGTFEVAARRLASRSDCRVHRLPEAGKGAAIRWAFEHVDARAFVLVDADHSYRLDRLKELIDLVVVKGADMAAGDRMSEGAYHEVHGKTLRWLGNRVASGIFRAITRRPLRDVLSGLRVVDGAFAKRVVLEGRGFELESELSLAVWAEGGHIAELPVGYRGRPGGEESKLLVSRDGPAILWTLAVGGLARRASLRRGSTRRA
jgi:glycosyltransferase involved in cell wall biosynthesis